MAEIGDLVAKSGINTEPGVVAQKNPDGTVLIDTDPMKLNEFHRYANTTGLSESDKVKFNQILDDIYAKNDDVEKINDMQTKIDQLRRDPTNHKLVQYLRNQQSFLVRSAQKLPRTYNLDADKVKSSKS